MAKDFWGARKKHKKRAPDEGDRAGEMIGRNGLGTGQQRPVSAPFAATISLVAQRAAALARSPPA